MITGFEYTYDDLSRIIEEKCLADNTKLCYAYDNLNRVTARTIKNATTNAVISTETFTYDAAGNITDAPDSCFQYDTNNRLTVFNGNSVSYDMDGNMLNNSVQSFAYDSANRLITAAGHTYTYNAEDVRIRNLCTEEDTTYTYNTNCKLSQMLTKTTNGSTTKYVYGRGLIGEETGSTLKTYHFDCRGSTVAITDVTGNITDTFAYDTYGKQIARTGTSEVIFGYNGRDGVVTDDNGLIYMRARCYAPNMKRFVNADIVAGAISNAITLNRFAYANGNPVSFVDPFGLSAGQRNYQARSADYYSRAMRLDEEQMHSVVSSTSKRNYQARSADYYNKALQLDEEQMHPVIAPSALEAAYMARHIYGATKNNYRIDLGAEFGGWKLQKILIDDNGFKMGVYYKTVNGHTGYAIVNAGTTTWNDCVDDVAQPFGLSSDMKRSISLSKEFCINYPSAEVTFVGHSKGGAEAAANAVATDRDAIIFNPATVNLAAYSLNSRDYTSDMTAYIVEGEILNKIFGVISTPIDEKEALKKDNFWIKLLKLTPPGQIYDLVESLFDHSIDVVIESLINEGYN